MFKSTRFLIVIISLLLLLPIGGIFFYRYLQKKNELPEHIQKIQNIKKGDIQLTVYDLNENAIHISSFLDKVLVINLWATWCAPCIEELPSLNNLARTFPDQLVILAISTERTDVIENFLMAFRNLHSNFIPANVDQKTLRKSFTMRAFPETYILDKNGKLSHKILGPQKWDSKKWKQKIKLLVEAD